MGHSMHNVYDTDREFVIDPLTRVISPKSTSTKPTKILLMQNDHNSERFTFELPLKIEEHNMSECDRVQVHYINISESGDDVQKGVYPVEDLQISPAGPDVVICSWLISSNATKYVGTLNFALRFICGEETNPDYSWNTSPYTGIGVGQGIDNTGAVTEKYADVLQEWYNELNKKAEEMDEYITNSINEIIDDPTASVHFANKEYVKDTALSVSPSVTEQGHPLVISGAKSNIPYNPDITLYSDTGMSSVASHTSVFASSTNLIPMNDLSELEQSSNGYSYKVNSDGSITVTSDDGIPLGKSELCLYEGPALFTTGSIFFGFVAQEDDYGYVDYDSVKPSYTNLTMRITVYDDMGEQIRSVVVSNDTYIKDLTFTNSNGLGSEYNTWRITLESVSETGSLPIMDSNYGVTLYPAINFNWFTSNYTKGYYKKYTTDANGKLPDLIFDESSPEPFMLCASESYNTTKRFKCTYHKSIESVQSELDDINLRLSYHDFWMDDHGIFTTDIQTNIEDLRTQLATETAERKATDEEIYEEISDYETRISNLEETVGDGEGNLGDRVSALEETVGNGEGNLGDRVSALEDDVTALDDLIGAPKGYSGLSVFSNMSSMQTNIDEFREELSGYTTDANIESINKSIESINKSIESLETETNDIRNAFLLKWVNYCHVGGYIMNSGSKISIDAYFQVTTNEPWILESGDNKIDKLIDYFSRCLPTQIPIPCTGHVGYGSSYDRSSILMYVERTSSSIQFVGIGSGGEHSYKLKGDTTSYQFTFDTVEIQPIALDQGFEEST